MEPSKVKDPAICQSIPEQGTEQYYEHTSYFEADEHAMPTFRDSEEKKPIEIGLEKSSSPPHSSTPTTGTTTTPTSVGNNDIIDNSKGSAPGFPQESLSSRAQSGSPAYLGVTPRYGGISQDTQYSQDPSSFRHDQPESSKADRYNPSTYPSALKLLVSNNVAGSIIGRSGQTISELQSQSSSRIKLSQAGDFYPGTQDRVCLIQGEPEQVKTALRLLLERLFMLQEHQYSQQMAWQLMQRQKIDNSTSFDFIVRLLVPSSACGMIIGKSGSNIKFMEETTGVLSVRLSPKDTSDTGHPSAAAMNVTAERVVTITGQNVECCLSCLYVILDGMTSHPDLARYNNMTTSYSRVVPEPVYAKGRPPIMIPASPSTRGLDWDIYSPNPRRIASSPDLGGGILVSEHHMPPSPEPRVRQPIYAPVYGLESGPIPPHLSSTSAPDLLAVQLEQSLQVADSSPSTPTLVPQTPILVGNYFQVRVQVPDAMVGSILGRSGHTLSELQGLSGTRIRISQRGEYVPGTRNRIVTIQGPTAQNVWQAQYWMSQRLILPPTATESSPPYPPSS